MSSKSSQSKSSRHSSSTTKASSHPYASYTASHEEKAYYTYANTYSSNYSYSHSSNSDVSSWHLPDAIDIEDEDITFDGQPLSALFEEARCGHSPSSSPRMDEMDIHFLTWV